MSGGSHDYAYSKLEDIADSFYTQYLPPSHLKQRKKIAEVLRLMAKICKDVEWIDSGDCGEDDWVEVEKMLNRINISPIKNRVKDK